MSVKVKQASALTEGDCVMTSDGYSNPVSVEALASVRHDEAARSVVMVTVFERVLVSASDKWVLVWEGETGP